MSENKNTENKNTNEKNTENKNTNEKNTENKNTELRIVPIPRYEYRIEGVLNGRYTVLGMEDVEINVIPKNVEELKLYIINFINKLDKNAIEFVKALLQ